MTLARATRQSDKAGNDKMPKRREKPGQVGKAEGSLVDTPAAREDSGWGDSVGRASVSGQEPFTVAGMQW